MDPGVGEDAIPTTVLEFFVSAGYRVGSKVVVCIELIPRLDRWAVEQSCM